MIFIHDTRDQQGKHDNLESWMAEHGHELIRETMKTGDVMLLGDGSILIDLKSLGLSEVYSNLVHDHARFRNECIRAQEDQVRLIVLIEENDISCMDDVKAWHNPQIDRRMWRDKHDAFMIERGLHTTRVPPKKPPVPSDRLAGMMDAMTRKYGVEWHFCRPEETGNTVFHLLTDKWLKGGET